MFYFTPYKYVCYFYAALNVLLLDEDDNDGDKDVDEAGGKVLEK